MTDRIEELRKRGMITSLAKVPGDKTDSIEVLRVALEDIRSRSAMNAAMHPNPYELTARLGDIYQIADAALAREGEQ